MVALAQIGTACGVSRPAYAQAIEQQIPAQMYVDYRLNGALYRVPEKYLYNQPSAKELGALNTTANQFSFAFWLPDREPSQTRMISLTTFWPREPSRPSSGDNDFVVEVVSVQILPAGEEEKEVLPSRRLRNTLAYLLPEPERAEDTMVWSDTNLLGRVYTESFAPRRRAQTRT